MLNKVHLVQCHGSDYFSLSCVKCMGATVLYLVYLHAETFACVSVCVSV